ncbi:bifunctional 2-C-methyl-D-erythritol 4-phosphate cytidylyltransferase/2-C-methyl-D-erythritol 2,4-cyclodiphosphate synthase [Pseudoruegeria sp. SK021]|uniref:bifunctional 2-C-methyl-D-erythritol 4-phosphate cytidylyltransferase/2-C-methyl-D-erythritol 2,4-cyclodiphosphate synthase n=1 Tax=Pseudoruegeria sp. SK021 TaxID=1933035 RepID=UPI000A2366F4|nr:bifunctional 2-C-methyl-D-erythritol 4-phosphate cytidylyltransferase/2-C-methyl-D-erythritol 2,4-cyclodiphosphate synthase [Pseudoruegeria sp. SK021]OSP55255.1 bifunctional 2-C-methyl-D-erythritol 4-phosphate cytidylyltransferase/2-C-methyl-D-erythritol 2,4-cyclodiphosphate synthase [Pseudoruegeria sp. SK021]
MHAAALIVAAGRGTRAGGMIPKQYQLLDGKTVLEHALTALGGHPNVSQIVVVLHPEDRDRFKNMVTCPSHLPVTIVVGGASRDASVRAGLEAIIAPCDAVLIHDAARPLLPQAVIDRVLNALQTAPGAAPALGVTDALWTGAQGHVSGAVDRTGLFRAQTPQGFRLDDIRAAHAAHPGGAMDDVEVARAHGLDVTIVEGDERNFKITHPGDLARAESLLTVDKGMTMDIRTGNGFDVHKFGPGSAVTLCGVVVPHDHGLVGHSDADVGMHAVTDAIYGALALGDIGQHFPPSDPQWKGAASEIFLRHAMTEATARGFALSNADCTLICEHPKIGPHAAAMRAAMAAIMGVDLDRISVKATTSERLGFTGREEGIAALASVTLVKA